MGGHGQVLICDEDAHTRSALRSLLRKAGYEVVLATSVAEALDRASICRPDAVLAELELPDGDAVDLCRALREWSDAPFLVVTGVERPTEKVCALDAGADDYILKPFAPEEIVARLRAHLRRVPKLDGPHVARFGELVIDRAARRVRAAGREVALTTIEYQLLSVLAANAGQLMTYRALINATWGPGYIDGVSTLRTHICNLRRKIEEPLAGIRYVQTHRDAGYLLAVPQRQEQAVAASGRPGPVEGGEPFRHSALVHDGRDAFLEGVVPFLAEGVDAGEPTMVAMRCEQIRWVREALGERARVLEFVDMARLGRNPARLVPAWQRFLAKRRPGRGLRGVGEPIWAQRCPDETAESLLHEALLNTALTNAEGLQVLCTYDAATLSADVLAEARRTHPVLLENGTARESDDYTDDAIDRFTAALPAPPGDVGVLAFQRDAREITGFLTSRARAAGLRPAKVADLLVACSEVATNTIRHGGGRGLVRVWSEDTKVVVEVEDGAWLHDPLVGRRDEGSSSTWGVWAADQVCDLVQVRSSAVGTVVRLHMSR